jgi:hypothetical protein
MDHQRMLGSPFCIILQSFMTITEVSGKTEFLALLKTASSYFDAYQTISDSASHHSEISKSIVVYNIGITILST